MKNSMLFAFSTSSSAATIPINLKTVEENLGVKISSFIYCSFGCNNKYGWHSYHAVMATVFLANTYGVELTMSDFMSVILIAT